MCVFVNLKSGVCVPALVNFCLHHLEEVIAVCIRVLCESCAQELLKATLYTRNIQAQLAKGKAATISPTWAETVEPMV